MRHYKPKKRRGALNLGFAPEHHRERAAHAIQTARVEAGVVRRHLSRGECAAAVRGLAMTGWALGKASSDRAGAAAIRRRRGEGVTARGAAQVRALADKVIKACGVPHAKKSRRKS